MCARSKSSAVFQEKNTSDPFTLDVGTRLFLKLDQLLMSCRNSKWPPKNLESNLFSPLPSVGSYMTIPHIISKQSISESSGNAVPPLMHPRAQKKTDSHLTFTGQAKAPTSEPKPFLLFVNVFLTRANTVPMCSPLYHPGASACGHTTSIWRPSAPSPPSGSPSPASSRTLTSPPPSSPTRGGQMQGIKHSSPRSPPPRPFAWVCHYEGKVIAPSPQFSNNLKRVFKIFNTAF